MRWVPLFLLLLGCQSSGSEPTETEMGTTGTKTDRGEQCELSEIGLAVHEAAYFGPANESSVPVERLLTYDSEFVESLLDGEEIFTHLGDLIAEAEHDVNIAMFVFNPETDPWDAIADGVTRLADRQLFREADGDPIEIRIVVNTNNITGRGEEARANVRAFDALNIDPSLVNITVASRGSWTRGAMHQKLAIIDGSIVHIGGANVQDQHNWRTGTQPWRDSAYVLQGEIADSLMFDFEQMWSESEAWTCDGSDCDSTETEPFERAPAQAAEGCTPMIALTRLPRGGINNDVDHPHGRGFIAAMDAATERLRIQTPNLNDDAVRDAILRALGRGVRVELIIPISFNDRLEGLPSMGGTNLENVDRLYSSASDLVGPDASCELFDVRWFGQPEVGIVDGNVEGQMHVKYMSIDGQMAIFGSTNMDTQSWNYSGEANVAIDDQEVTEQLDQDVFDVSYAHSLTTEHCAQR